MTIVLKQYQQHQVELFELLDKLIDTIRLYSNQLNEGEKGKLIILKNEINALTRKGSQ